MDRPQVRLNVSDCVQSLKSLGSSHMTKQDLRIFHTQPDQPQRMSGAYECDWGDSCVIPSAASTVAEHPLNHITEQAKRGGMCSVFSSTLHFRLTREEKLCSGGASVIFLTY